MAVPSAAVVDGLREWINTFPGVHVNNLADLADGIVLRRVLHNIFPLSTPKPLNEDIQQNSDSWINRFNNLQRLVNDIKRCVDEDLQVFVASIKLLSIAKESNVTETQKLVMALVACAVQCDDKDVFVQRIMSLDPSTQRILKDSIEQLQDLAGGSASGSVAPSRSETSDDLTEVQSDATQLPMLRAELSDLQIAYNALMEENQKLSTRLLSEPVLSDTTNARSENVLRLESKRLHGEVERLSLELTTMKDLDFKKDAKIASLSRQVEKLQEVSKQAEAWRDEVDVLQNEMTRLRKLESTNAQLKKRLDLLEHVEVQLKETEAQSEKLAGEIAKMEREVAEVSVMQTQMKVLEARNASLEREYESLLQTRQEVVSTTFEPGHRRKASRSDRASQFQENTLTEEVEIVQSVPLSQELQVDDQWRTLIEIRDKLEEENSQLKQQVAKLSASAANAADAEALQRELRESRASVDELHRQLVHYEQMDVERQAKMRNDREESNRYREALKADLTKVEADLDTTMNELEEAKKEAKRWRVLSAQAESKVQDLTEELRHSADEVTALEKRVQARKQELAQSREANATLQSELDRLSQENQTLNITLVNAQIDLKRLQSLKEKTTVSETAADEVVRLQAELSEKTAQVARANEALRQKSAELSRVQIELDDQATQLQEARLLLKHKISELDAAASDRTALRTRLNELEIQLKDSNEKEELLRQNFSELQLQATKHNEEVRGLKRTNETLKQSLQSTQSELDLTLQERQKISSDLITLQAEVRRLQNSQEKTSNEAQQEVADVVTRLQAELSEKSAQCARANELLKQKSAELSRSQVELDDKAIQIKESGFLLKQRVTELDTAVADRTALRGRVSELEIKLKDAQQAESVLQQHTSELQEELVKANEQLRSAKRNNESLLESLQTAKNSLVGLQSRFDQATQERNGFQTQLLALEDRMRAEQQELQLRKEDLDRRTLDLNELKAKLLNSDTSHFTEMVDKLLAEKATLQRSLLEEKETKLQLEKTLMNQLSKAQFDVKSAQQEASQALIKLEVELKERIALASRMEELLREKSSELTRAQVELSEKTTQIMQHDRLMKQKLSELEQLTNEKTTLQGRVSDLELQLQLLQSRVQMASQGDDALRQHSTELEGQISKLNDQLRGLKRANDTLQESKQSLEDSVESLQRRQRQIEVDRDEARSKFLAQEESIRAEQRELKFRKEDLDRMALELNELKDKLLNSNKDHFSEMFDKVLAERSQLQRALVEEKESKLQQDKLLRDEITGLKQKLIEAQSELEEMKNADGTKLKKKSTTSAGFGRFTRRSVSSARTAADLPESTSVVSVTSSTSSPTAIESKERATSIRERSSSVESSLSTSARSISTSSTVTDASNHANQMPYLVPINGSSVPSRSISAHSLPKEAPPPLSIATEESSPQGWSRQRAVTLVTRPATPKAQTQPRPQPRVIELFDLIDAAASHTLDNQSYTPKNKNVQEIIDDSDGESIASSGASVKRTKSAAERLRSASRRISQTFSGSPAKPPK